MHDFDWDVLQKKRIANNARRMKNGSKSKKCSLPSDHMTAAEWKRRNGPVSTYKLDAPMSWDEFNSMPDDLKVKYIQNLRELYGANDRMLGEMFFVHFSTVALIRKKLGITERMPRLAGLEKEKRDAMWAAFCNGVVGGNEKPAENVTEEPATVEERYEEPVPEPVLEDPEPEKDLIKYNDWVEQQKTPSEPVADLPVVELKERPLLNLDELTAVFSGEFDAQKFLHWILSLPMPTGDVKIRVEVTRK